ncbi:MAG: Fic family protein, partial [Flavobacteriales bacterium]
RMLETTYTLHSRVLALLASISERLGEVRAGHLHHPSPDLRKAYKVSTIHATLALEDNPLDRRPIAELLDGKPPHTTNSAILEVINTQRLYELLPQLDPFLAQDLCHAHGELMHGLALDAGSYRTGPMNVVYDDHEAPRTSPAENIPSEVEELLHFAENDEAPLLITSCVLHYGLIYLRPFSAGNGRIARLWQKRVLMRQWPVFAFLPLESFILNTRPAYYASMAYADRQGDCGGFITYMMERIDEALQELLTGQRPVLSGTERVDIFLRERERSRFSRKDYRNSFPELSTATASRDLAEATASGVIERSGTGRVSNYRPVPRGISIRSSLAPPSRHAVTAVSSRSRNQERAIPVAPTCDGGSRLP